MLVRATRSVLILYLVAACSAGGDPVVSTSLGPTAAIPLATPGVDPTGVDVTPEPTPEAMPTDTPASLTPGADVGTVVVTVADDGLRMRSLPSLAEASRRYKPLLPVGIQLFVLDGPVEADGYAWYQVAPIGTDFPEPWGWVAAASRQGEPWLKPGTTRCPPVPTDVGMLYAYDFGTEMACFGGEPMTLTGRILACNCEMDPGENIEPPSFRWQYTEDNAGPLLLTPPGTVSPSDFMSYAAVLRLATDADVPDRLPVGEDVEVTGMFDHPAAAGCRYDENFDGEAEPSPYCRGLFLVTSIR